MGYIEIINNLIETIKKDGYSTKGISDTHHTFEMLYYQRMILFALVCQAYPTLSFKSKKHYDEVNDPMFNGDFIVGINTPKGLATFHFKLKYWDLFNIQELEHAPKYDGYSDEEDTQRLSSLLNNNKLERKL